MILFQNSGDCHAEWSFYSNGSWISFGELIWPWGDTYEEPEPVRICYPAVQIRNKAASLSRVSDIVEPE